jgi:iron complex transport system substrate-binding protein
MVGVFVGALLLLLAACRGDTPARASVPAGQPIVIVDDVGRTVTLAHPARRVVSLVPSVTETVIALGVTDRLVGRTRYDRDTAVAALPVVGGGLDPNFEAMVDLAPDLVVSWFTEERPEIRRRLDDAGIATLSLSLQDTTDAFRTVTLMGRALGRTEAADSLLARLRDSLAATRRLAEAAGRRRVFYVVYNDPPMTVGPATFIAQILDLAGGENIFADATTNWPSVSLEEVVRRDPDVVVLPVGEMPARTRERLRGEAGWRELRAVRGDCIVLVDADVVNRPGPHIARAAEELRVAIHREGCGS